MALSRTAKTGLAVVLSLGVLLWLGTLGLFFRFSAPAARGGAFLFALGYISFLELLAVAYLAVPFVPRLRRGVSPALYPVFGLVIGIYIARALIGILLTHTIPFLNSGSTQWTLALLSLAPFLILMGILLITNTWQVEQTAAIRAERSELALIGVGVSETYSAFVNARASIEPAHFTRIEPLFKRLKERFQFCTPFQRQPESAPGIGAEIQRRLEQLSGMVAALRDQPAATAEQIGPLVTETLQLMERREKLLVNT